jgi:RNA polymerase sigma factor (sigma-70 family)
VLFPRYTLLVYGVCMKYLKNEQNAKDATQQIFIKCIDELAKYQVSYFKSWVYMITKNHCLMHLRTQKNIIDIDKVSYSLLADEAEDTISKIKETEITLEIMQQSITELNAEQKQCITLFYLEKNSYQDIAEKLEIPYMQVKSAIQNGKRNLKKIIETKMLLQK